VLSACLLEQKLLLSPEQVTLLTISYVLLARPGYKTYHTFTRM
jgi:hypothetical protein